MVPADGRLNPRQAYWDMTVILLFDPNVLSFLWRLCNRMWMSFRVSKTKPEILCLFGHMCPFPRWGFTAIIRFSKEDPGPLFCPELLDSAWNTRWPSRCTWNSCSSFFSIQSVTWTKVTSLSPSFGRAFSSIYGGFRNPYLLKKTNNHI